VIFLVVKRGGGTDSFQDIFLVCGTLSGVLPFAGYLRS
jgi:hypothetical protein